jgi:hypothetical protein
MLAQQAETTACSIADPPTSARAVSRVVGVLVRTGGADHAATTARAITDLWMQAWTLAEAARAPAQAGEPEQARQLALEAT